MKVKERKSMKVADTLLLLNNWNVLAGCQELVDIRYSTNITGVHADTSLRSRHLPIYAELMK